MDDQAIKGLELLGLKNSDAFIPENPTHRIRVEGYDTSLSPKALWRTLKEVFSSCGQISHVDIIDYPETDVFLPVVHKCAYVYIRGDGAEEKALKLSGTDAGGWTVVATADPELKPLNLKEPSEAELQKLRAKTSMIKVTGYDNAPPTDETKSALRKHFASCGEVEQVLIVNPLTRAVLVITGDDAEEKALALSGSIMGGFSLVTCLLKPAKPVENKEPKTSRIQVTGYDCALPLCEIKCALRKHFATCGEVQQVLIVDPKTSMAVLVISGHDAEEQALALSGSIMGGCSLVTCLSEPVKPVENKQRLSECSPLHIVRRPKKARIVWGAELAMQYRNTEKAKRVWEAQIGDDIDQTVKDKTWEAEMARRDRKTVTVE